MKYRTKSLAEATALLADTDMVTEFVGLETSERQNKFKFVITVEADETVFNQWTLDYINGKIRVNPKQYDAEMNMLRDRLSLAKN